MLTRRPNYIRNRGRSICSQENQTISVLIDVEEVEKPKKNKVAPTSAETIEVEKRQKNKVARISTTREI